MLLLSSFHSYIQFFDNIFKGFKFSTYYQSQEENILLNNFFWKPYILEKEDILIFQM